MISVIAFRTVILAAATFVVFISPFVRVNFLVLGALLYAWSPMIFFGAIGRG